jgi:hypothetical protein
MKLHARFGEQTAVASWSHTSLCIHQRRNVMTIENSAPDENSAAARRGDDTHWWKAYELHSKAMPGIAAKSRRQSPRPTSLAHVDSEPSWPTETEIHRAASKALQRF